MRGEAGVPSRGSFWPSRRQRLLLQTALADPDTASEAWRELRASLEIQALEPGTIAALPLAYRAVSDSLPNDPLLPRLKGIYRATWVRNNLLIKRLAEAVEALDGAGVEPLLIGSLAAAARYYAELALRPTPTLDFLIDPEQVLPATRALGRLGWSSPLAPSPSGEQPITFHDAAGNACLLRVSAALDLPLGRDALTSASVIVRLGNRDVRALAPTDDLLVACVSGARIRAVRSVDWLVDIAQILKSQGAELAWDRLLDRAAAHGQLMRLRKTLDYVNQVLGVAVPDQVSEMLRSQPVAVRERLAYASAGASAPGLGSFPQAVAEHLVATREDSAWHAVASFPGFLRRRWNAENAWQLLRAGGQRLHRSVTRAPGRSA